jgi:hypothetical protein
MSFSLYSGTQQVSPFNNDFNRKNGGLTAVFTVYPPINLRFVELPFHNLTFPILAMTVAAAL